MRGTQHEQVCLKSPPHVKVECRLVGEHAEHNNMIHNCNTIWVDVGSIVDVFFFLASTDHH